MLLHASKRKITFNFKFDAGTSRGVLKQKDSYFLLINDLESETSVWGIGEAAPLAGLSCDDFENYEAILDGFIEQFNSLELEVFEFNLPIIISQLIPSQFPSIRFAFETALLDIINGGNRIIFKNDFSDGIQHIPINGLIWMGDEAFMKAQIDKKLADGFSTIKMKIGAIDFETELKLLQSIRSIFSADQITLRVDANGAFHPNEVREVLNELKKLQIHSIEQPIAKGQPDQMAKLCEENILPIALDEELIGVNDYIEKQLLLKQIRPHFIILKPTLHGGFVGCKEWIEIAKRNTINWWMTSALESNIGLNAISQFCGNYPNLLPQGLGTGQLYTFNFDSPLTLENGLLSYDTSKNWNLDNLL